MYVVCYYYWCFCDEINKISAKLQKWPRFVSCSLQTSPSELLAALALNSPFLIMARSTKKRPASAGAGKAGKRNKKEEQAELADEEDGPEEEEEEEDVEEEEEEEEEEDEEAVRKKPAAMGGNEAHGSASPDIARQCSAQEAQNEPHYGG